MGCDVLEPNLSCLEDGTKINLVFDVVLRSGDKSLCRSKCHQQFFTIDHLFVDVRTSVTALQALVFQSQHGKKLTWDSNTRWIIHPPQHSSGLLRIVEACSGIGIMGKGFECTGAQTACYVDNNSEYCRWLRDHCNVPVIEGEKHQDDPRSASFWGMLQAGYQLQSLMIVLECTQEAATAPCVQTGLKEFEKQTGYKAIQTALNLHTVWPARRTRWWTVLVHPALEMDELRPLPTLEFLPGIMHLMPAPMMMNDEQLANYN